METATFDAIMASLDEVRHRYLEAAGTTPHPDQLRNWRPEDSGWRRLQALTGYVPGIRVERIMIDGHHIEYARVGSGHGQPVVLLHGFGASKENWLSLVPAIRRREITLYMPDLPGFGQSDYHHDARYTYGEQARRLSEWARRLALPAAHWIGSSMGGATAATLAANHPESVRSVVLMNAAGMGGARLSPLENELVQGKNPLIPSDTEQTRALFRIATHRYQGILSRVMPLAIGPEMRHREPVNRHLFADMLQPEVPVPRLLERVQAPVQVIWGERDQVVDVSCAHHYGALLPDARVRVLRDIGHLPMFEAPLRSARIIRDFWRNVE